MWNIKLIIFDLDGTLIDAYAAIVSSFNYVMRVLGLKMQSASSVRRSVGWGDLNLLKPYVPRKILSHAVNLYRKHHRRSLLEYSRLYPQVNSLLLHLKTGGYKLAVASNRPTEFSLILLNHLRILNYFDYVLCADKLREGKTHPEILNKIIRRFSVKKSQVLYVGDMVIDVQAGKRAGVKTIVIAGGSSSSLEIKKERPFKMISRLNQLTDIIGVKTSQDKK